MASESDPLLPKGNPAPEISGFGYSPVPTEDHVEKTSRRDDNITTGTSPLSTILGLFTIVVGIGLVIALLVPGGLRSSDGTPENSSPTWTERVDKILSENPLIDGHNDLAIMIRYLFQNKIYDERFTEPFENGGMPFHVDLPRLKAGKVGGSFWSAYAGCPQNGTDFSDANYAEAVAETLSQLDVLRRLAVAYPDVFAPASDNSSTALAKFETSGKLISPFALEGLHQIGNSYSNLRLFKSLGAGYATLTHNCHNIFADAALITNSSGSLIAAPPLWGGISKSGQTLVKEMNRLGMLVDLSHVSTNTMIDVLGGRPESWSGSAAPVMFSHSSAYSLCPHPRNVPDDVLKLVQKTNSVVMVNFSPDFISCVPSNSTTGIPDLYPQNATLRQVAMHISYIGELIGFDHVGIGSDFDGIISTPEGLDDVSKYPHLIAHLLAAGVSDEDAAKVVGRNILRVWGAAEEVSSNMQKDGVLPAEDTVEFIDLQELSRALSGGVVK